MSALFMREHRTLPRVRNGPKVYLRATRNAYMNIGRCTRQDPQKLSTFSRVGSEPGDVMVFVESQSMIDYAEAVPGTLSMSVRH